MILVAGGDAMAVELVVRSVVCIAVERHDMLGTLMSFLFNFSGLSDDYMASLATTIGVVLARGGQNGRWAADLFPHYMGSLDMHWSRRVRRLLRETAPDVYVQLPSE